MLNYMVHNHCSNNIVLTFLNQIKININNFNIYWSIMANECNVRWAFNTTDWKPTEDEILDASRYIQTEEKERILKFAFLNDAKSSFIGRLLLRKFVATVTSIPYEEIAFGRDERGKPILLGVGDIPLSFNVSHQGDYVVLAGNSNVNVGIDVMKLEPSPTKDIPEFFRLMTRQLSPHEWSTVRSFPTEMEQMACFYRIWCLKESYVKNIGVGVTIPLQDISFAIKQPKLKMEQIYRDTVLYKNNVLLENWVFEETLLDDKHTVAVSIQVDKNSDYVPVSYTFLTLSELVREAKPLHEYDHKFKTDFMKKVPKL